MGPPEETTVSRLFEELANHDTRMGELTLRRRREPVRDVDVYEVKLGDEFLMSSLFTVAEVELARLGLAACRGEDLAVVVGGLGLGYTACAALEDPRVGTMLVVEALEPVLAWHEDGLLPEVAGLAADPRTRLIAGDFFASAAGDGFDPAAPGRRFDAVLLDIDHSPRHVLDPSHEAFYSPAGLTRLRRHLRPGGVFALWSDDPPDEGFLADLDEVFDTSAGHVVSFPNFLTGGESANTVYVAS
jgi:spermidine synthase